MKKKSLVIIMSAVAVVSLAAITTGVVYSLKTKTTTKTENIVLNELAKKVKVDYINKHEIEVSNIKENDILFSEFDKIKYEIIEKKITINEADKTKIVVSFKLKETKTSIISEEIIIEILGFKKPQDEIPVPPNENPKNPINTDPKTEEPLKPNSEPSDPVMPIEPTPIPKPEEPKKDPETTKEHLNSVAQTIKETDFVYSEGKTNLPVAYANKENFKINNLPDGVTFSILSIEVNVDDTTAAIVKYELTKDTIKSDLQSIEITGFKSVDDEIKRLNDIAKKPNSIEFIGGDKKDFDISQLKSKSLFNFKNLPEDYTFEITQIGVASDFTTAIISYQIFKTGQTIKSNVHNAKIPGFKKPNLKNYLNTIIKKATVDFSGKKAETEVANIDKKMFKAKGLASQFNFEITSVTPKSTNKTVAIVKFTIGFARDHAEKSDEKTIEISGFKAPARQQDDLNKIIDKVKAVPVDNPKYILLKNLNNLDGINLKFLGLPNDVEVTNLKKTKKTGDDSKLVVTFKIKEKNGAILSKEITKEINGFQKELKTQKELDDDAKKVRKITYKGDTSKVEIKDVDVKNIVINNLPNSYEISRIVLVPNSDGTSAKVYFKIKEKNGTLISDTGMSTLENFKKSNLKTLELNAIADIVEATYENSADTAFNSVEYVDTKKIKFTSFNATKYEVIKKEFVVLNSDGDTLEIFFSLKEKDTNTESDLQSKKITGFVSKNTRKAQIEQLVKTMTVDYPGKSEKILTTITDVDNSKIEFNGYDKNKYEVILKNVYFDEDDNDEIDFVVDKTTVQLDIVVKEIASGIETGTKYKEIRGFKKA